MVLEQYLRRLISGRARQPTGLLCRRTLVAASKAFRHSEIQAFHLLPGGGHDIFGLEVAIDDATGMGCHQGICALHGGVEKLLNSERIPAARRAG